MCSSSAEVNFLVDDLLEFPTELDEEPLSSPFGANAEVASLLFNYDGPPLHADFMSSNNNPHVELDKLSLKVEEPSSGLCVPPDELVHQLEWLSSFSEDNCFIAGDTKLLPLVESSSSRTSSGLDRCIKVETPMRSCKLRESFNSQSPVSVLDQGNHSYTKACGIIRAYKSQRVRKARTGGRIWSLDILKPILVNNRMKDAYDSSSLFVTSSSLVYSEPLCSFLPQDGRERPFKKTKQAALDADPGLARRCTHCLVQKTPQWRAGPQGAKTLCNACGVRYKSGRLVPEYRPAASPSFVSEVHSNSHRRILEMRRAKEVESCVRLHNVEVGSREEGDEQECGGELHVSYGSCEESMADLQVCEELGMLKGGSFCERVKVTDDGSCTDDATSNKELATKGNPFGEGVACDAIEIDATTGKEEFLP